MNSNRIFSIIQGVQISEKANRIADESNQFVFKVSKTANKLEIRKAVENLFDVKVKSVQTSNVKGKRKRFGQTIGRRASWKKALVSLKEGYEIELESMG